MLLFESILFKPSIGKRIEGVIKLLKGSDNPFVHLASIDRDIRVIGFDYSSYEQMVYVRDLLLDCWSQFLILMKSVCFTQQCTLYEYMSCIMRRAEFCLENCGYSESNPILSEKSRLQLSQYISLLQLSTLYVPRALIANVTKTREFVFSVFTVGIFRMSDYREAFFSHLCEHTQKSSDSAADSVFLPFSATPEGYLDKYLNPNLLEEIKTRRKKKHENASILLSCSSLYHPELRKKGESYEISRRGFDVDLKFVHKSIPEPLVIRADQVVYHEEEKIPAETEFSVDDHSFREVIISQDFSDNPYATTNIQDILRSHRYWLPSDKDPEGCVDLPPLKLPDMTVQVNLLAERCMHSIEEEASARIFERDHPSLFAWDSLGITGSTSVSSESYLNMQSVDILCQAKGLLAQFITFYFSYVHTFSEEDESICWSSVPGFFILERIFLNEFQSYHTSRLSGGILRMNLGVDKILSDSVASQFCYACCVNGEFLNLVLSVVFDKCNTSVFLDISRSMQVLFDLLEYIKSHHRLIDYNHYSPGLYDEIYQSYEIRLLLFLQSESHTDRASSKPTPPHSIPPPSFSTMITDSIRGPGSVNRRGSLLSIPHPSSLTLPFTTEHEVSVGMEVSSSKPVSQSPFAVPLSLDFVEEVTEEEESGSGVNQESSSKSPQERQSVSPCLSPASRISISSDLNSTSHRISHYNSLQSLVYTEGSSIDMMYASSINHSLRIQRRLPSTVIQNGNNTQESLQKFSENPEMKEVNSKQLFLTKKVKGFTLLQGIYFLIENNVLFSRGEGLDFFHLLRSHHVLEPISYDRRFRTTIYHIIPHNELALFEYPEISAYSHKLFEDHVNYVYLVYVLKGLLKSSHLQVLEKALTFIYYHVDFFNGSHRLLLFKEVIFPNFVRFFTHWSDHIRHIFHRLIVYKMFRTRLSYLPGYLSIDILHGLFKRVSDRYKPKKSFFSFLDPLKNVDESKSNDEASIWDYDKEIQEVINKSYSSEKYNFTHAKVNEHKREEKILKTMQLMSVRETQFIDMNLMSMLKSTLHILMSVDDDVNSNIRNGKSLIPENQIQYYWVSFLEYIKILCDYEGIDSNTKPQRIAFNNFYNDGVDVVSNLQVSWKEVSEMETPVVDDGTDLKYFVTN